LALILNKTPFSTILHELTSMRELLDTQEQVEEQISLELAPSDTPNTDAYQPIFTLLADDDNTSDEPVNAD